MALNDQFKEVGLTLKDADKPFGGNDRIFGLDIQGGGFRAWVPGHVRVQVQAKDPKMHQVVLTVKEGVEAFQVEILKYQMQAGDKLIRNVGSPRSGRENMTPVLVERKTVAETRHFLCGVDERNHPFITQLNGPATSIRAAHELLKPPELRGLKIKGFGKNSKVKTKQSAYRQGEWFFVKASPEEVAKVEALVAGTSSQKKVPIQATRGNPHTVDERVVVPDWTGTKGRAWAGATYIRGKVRHDEHETLEFRDWMRVYRNQEKGGATAGASWVD